jgi:lipooligosaccharide transport system ATP-binding protein
MAPIIAAGRLRKEFNGLVAVKDISFQLDPSQCLGLLGPNGAGKTSTIRMVYGFSPMTSGRLEVFGMDIRTDWRKIKARIGVCQQENSLDPDLTVFQNLEVFSRYFNITGQAARKRADELLAFMGLDHKRKAKISELSGGMMRRLVLARALLNKPDLLILDEPTTGLDPQARHQVWERLEGLRAGGMSILLTTHYMEEASRLCDRVIIMDHGEILVQGTVAELIQAHVGRNVIEITRTDDQLRSHLRSQHVHYEDLGNRVIIYGNENDRLFDVIRDRFCRENCSLRMSTLEDVFLRLTGRELRE